MPLVTCPSCGEDDNLQGKCCPDDSVEITCMTCGTVWDRDGGRRCRLCGSDDLEYAPKALWEKGRGDQKTPAGRIDAYFCYACGGHNVTSQNPTPGPPEYVPSRRYDRADRKE